MKHTKSVNRYGEIYGFAVQDLEVVLLYMATSFHMTGKWFMLDDSYHMKTLCLGTEHPVDVRFVP